MKKYIQPYMEIDLFNENNGLLMEDSGNKNCSPDYWECSCDSTTCPTVAADGTGVDPWVTTSN